MSLLRIDEIFNFEKGVLQSSKCVPGEFNFITASSEWKTHNEYTHDCEALVFAAAASGSLGRTHYVNGKFISSDLCFIVTPKDQQKLPVDLKFYHILFNELKDEIVRNTKAGTSKEAIGLGSFGKYQLPYFDIDTQIEIKNRFVNSEEIKLDLSNELNNQLTLVKKLRQKFLQDAVQGKLVPQNQNDEPASELLKKIKAEKAKLIAEKKLKKEKELPPIKPEEIPFEIPENWVWCRLDNICLFFNGKAHEQHMNENGDFILVNSRFVSSSGFIYKRTSKQLTPLEVNDIAIVMSDVPKGRALGRCNLIEESNKYSLNQRIGGIKCFEDLNINYVKFLLDRNQHFLNFDDGKKQTNLRKDQILLCPIPLPPLSEQNRIVQKLDELMRYCNELEASIKESEIQNEKLLQQVLREALRKEPVEA